jgi:hypothetical protein
VRLRGEFDAFGAEHVPERYAAGRTWAIFALVMLLDLHAMAEAAAPGGLERPWPTPWRSPASSRSTRRRQRR